MKRVFWFLKILLVAGVLFQFIQKLLSPWKMFGWIVVEVCFSSIWKQNITPESGTTNWLFAKAWLYLRHCRRGLSFFLFFSLSENLRKLGLFLELIKILLAWRENFKYYYEKQIREMFRKMLISAEEVSLSIKYWYFCLVLIFIFFNMIVQEQEWTNRNISGLKRSCFLSEVDLLQRQRTVKSLKHYDAFHFDNKWNSSTCRFSLNVARISL